MPRLPSGWRWGLFPLSTAVEYTSLWKPLNSNRMTKQQLIEKVSAKTELGKTEAEVAVDSVLDLIADALRSNERVDLRGFGSFVVKERKERQGPQPSHRGDHHHRRKAGCEFQARQGTDGKAGPRRDGADAARGRMTLPEKSVQDGGAIWLK